MNDEKERRRRNPEEEQRLPQNLDAEKGLLGSMLLSPERVMAECHWLGDQHFHHPAHRTIFKRLRAMQDKKMPLDFITVTAELEVHNELLDVGGAVYVTELFTFVPAGGNWQYYIDIMAEKAVMRGMIAVGQDMISLGFGHVSGILKAHDQLSLSTPQEMLEYVEGELLKLRMDRAFEAAATHVADVVPEVKASLIDAHKHRGRGRGLKTGFVDFDRMTGGLKPGQVVVFAARPSDGKTSLATQCAIKFAQAEKVVRIFSLEMTKAELVERMICMEAPLDIGDVRYGFFSDDWETLVDDAIVSLKHLPIYIDETPALSIFEFRARARRARTKEKVDVIVVDYLQLMGSTSRQARDSRQNEIAEVSRAVKATAKELQIPIIVCAQLSREADQRAQPRLSDLRESGQIEQDADIVCLLHHPKKYSEDPEEQKDVRLIVAKHRNGPKGEVKLRFEKRYARFQGVNTQLFSNDPAKRQVIARPTITTDENGNGGES